MAGMRKLVTEKPPAANVKQPDSENQRALDDCLSEH